MRKVILEKKIGMIQTFDTNGKAVPVTVVKADPCVVVRKKTIGKDGYETIQIGFEDVGEKLVNEPKEGHYAKAGVSLKGKSKEFRSEDCPAYKIGQEAKADSFEAGDRIDISGASKGKRFQGVIRKWNANRRPMTHGSKFYRAVGSMGISSDSSRTFKNENMPGHMGAVNIAVLSLEVVKVTAEKDLILIEGGIPGPNKGIVIIRNAIKA